jgi:cation:H+ antiporter
MGMGLSIVAFALGAAVCLGTSWVLVSRLERVGERWGLSEALLGLMAALAADTPEITAAVTALARHQRAVGAGVVIGSNIFNLAALLGLGAVVAGRIGLHRKVVALGGAVALWIAIVCLVTVIGAVPVGVGLALVLLVFAPFVVVLGAKRSTVARLGLPRRWSDWLSSAVEEEELELSVALRPRRGTPQDAFVAAAALVVVVAASAIMELGASALAKHYAVASVVLGGLVLAAITSLPNAVAAVHLASKGRGAAALSTALNSNSLNVTVGLLIPGAVIGLVRLSGAGLLIVAWYVAMTALTLGLAYVDHGLRRSSGTLIIASYAVFVVVLLAVT